jgi:hypothetical protein
MEERRDTVRCTPNTCNAIPPLHASTREARRDDISFERAAFSTSMVGSLQRNIHI